MKMTAENDRYKKIMEILRKSRPDLLEPEEIEDKVIKRIQHENHRTGRVSDFIESLFGWVYIGWVRRSLIGAAIVLVGVFIYQQAFILKQVNNISKQVVSIGNESASVSSSEFDKKLTLYKISARLSPGREIKISENQLEELLDSYKSLQVKYKDLMRIIEENPELKQYIENKLNEERHNKPDI
jgi:parvulin-like peptidyl-prolyl isomerase